MEPAAAGLLFTFLYNLARTAVVTLSDNNSADQPVSPFLLETKGSKINLSLTLNEQIRLFNVQNLVSLQICSLKARPKLLKKGQSTRKLLRQPKMWKAMWSAKLQK